MQPGHYNYFRDYDPAIGRYVESDPIGLQAGLNTFGYVAASPLSTVDPYGLIGYRKPGPPRPGVGGISCDGSGGMSINYPPDFKGKGAECLKDCVDVHERIHIEDLRRKDPNVCKNVSKGMVPIFDSPGDNNGSERRAYDAELECLKKKLSGGGGGGGSDCECKPYIEWRIKDIPNQRRRYG